MAPESAVWLVLYAPAVRMRLTRRLVGPFADTAAARPAIPKVPSQSCVGWRLLMGRTPDQARLLDENGRLPTRRRPNPRLRSGRDVEDLARLAAEGGAVPRGVRRAGLFRRGLVGTDGRITPLGRRHLALAQKSLDARS